MEKTCPPRDESGVRVVAEWLNVMNAEYAPIHQLDGCLDDLKTHGELACIPGEDALPPPGPVPIPLGVVANLNAELGGRPWDVLCVGVMSHTPFTLGQVAQLLSLVVLVFGWILGFPPGFSTVTNTYFIGIFVDTIIAWDIGPFPTELIPKLVLLIFAIGLFTAGSLFYLRAGLGAGSRNGLMMGLAKRLGHSIASVRGGMELTIVTLGFLLKGPIGVGTLLMALILGPAV